MSDTTVLKDESCGEIEVCSDCMLVHANGESSPDRDPSQPEPWASIRFGYRVTMGGEHVDSCTDLTECDCDERGFSWSACEGCGSNSGGDRFAFTLWRHTLAEARAEHASTLAALPGSTVSGRIELLAIAAQWRGYVADRFKEERDFARWRTRIAA